MSKSWLAKYGVWTALAAGVFVWEITGVKTFRKVAGMDDTHHPSISEMVWSFQRRFGWKGQVIVAVVMLNLTAHFVFGTPLIPFVPGT